MFWNIKNIKVFPILSALCIQCASEVTSETETIECLLSFWSVFLTETTSLNLTDRVLVCGACLVSIGQSVRQITLIAFSA